MEKEAPALTAHILVAHSCTAAAAAASLARWGGGLL